MVAVRNGRVLRELDAAASSASTALSLLGGFELRMDGERVSVPSPARRLLVFLALGLRPMARIYVSQSLWADVTEKRADGNLRSALWKVSQLGSELVTVGGGQLELAPRVAVDYRESLALAHKMLDDPKSGTEPGVDENLLTRDLLPDWYDQWVIAEREQFHQLRLHALEDLCREYVARGWFGRAVRAGLAAVAGEPLRESANLALIRAYAAEGNVAEVIHHYRAYQDLLWEELAVSASPAITRLVDELTSH